MKLHLPKGLRAALLACVTSTVAAVSMLGGLVSAAVQTLDTSSLTYTDSVYVTGLLSQEQLSALIGTANLNKAFISTTLELSDSGTWTSSVGARTWEDRNEFHMWDNKKPGEDVGGANVARSFSAVSGFTWPTGHAINKAFDLDHVTYAALTFGLVSATDMSDSLKGVDIVLTAMMDDNTTYTTVLGNSNGVFWTGKQWKMNSFSYDDTYLSSVEMTAGAWTHADLVQANVDAISSTLSTLYWGRNEKDGDWNMVDVVWSTADRTEAGMAFHAGADAHFTTSGGGGAITVTEDVKVGNLFVAGTRAYTFNSKGGVLSVTDSVNVAANAVATFNTALNGEELALNVDGTLNLNADSTVKNVVMGANGQMLLDGGKVLEATESVTMRQESALSGSGTYKTAAMVLDVAKPGDLDHQPTVTGGAVLETASISGNGALHVDGATLHVTKETVVSNVQISEGSKVQVDAGATLRVSGNCTLAFGPESTMENQGKLETEEKGTVLVQSDLDLGEVDVKGLVMVDSILHTAVTRGSIASVIFNKNNGVFEAKENLTLGMASIPSGTLEVGGALTVQGIVTAGTVEAGSVTIADDSLSSLTVTGQLTAGTISMEKLSRTTGYIKAGSLGEGTGAFTVTEDAIKGLHAQAGDVVVLADLSAKLSEATELSINDGGFILDEDNNLLLMIAEDEANMDVVLNVTTADYIWTDAAEGTKNWGVGENWLGKKVPNAAATALVKSGDWTINMNEDGEADTLYFYRGADTKLTGDHSLSLGSELVVEDTAKVTVTDSVSIDTAKVKLNGELDLAADSRLETGALNGGSTGKLSSANPLVITGKGGVYKGSYGTATVELASGAEATLAAGKGLTLQGSGTATLTYVGKEAVIDSVSGNGMTLVLNGTNVDNSGNTLTSTAPSSVTGGRIVSGLSATATAATLSSSGSPVLVAADSLALSGTTVELVQTETNTFSMKLNSNGQRKDLVLGYLGGEDTNADVVLTGNLFSKYYENARLVGGVILVDLREVNFSDGVLAYTYNGRAGAGMLDDVYKQRDPQNSAPDGDLAAVMNAIESGAVAKSDHDRLAAAMAGASAAAMGYAYGKDVERQLHAIRNRTTGMGCAECVVNEDMPYVNAWVSAEGDFSRLAAENTYAGYSLNSWGGTVGCDLDFTNHFTAGLALTAMKGKFTSRSAEQGSGDLDRLYVSAFARYARRAWTHTFVGTIGTAEAKLDRTVSYAGGSYSTSGDTKGVAFGLMYEAGYTKALNESGSTCLQPLFSISYRHSTLDGYTERRSDAALHYSDIDMDVVTFSLGGRLQTVAGTSVYNRTSVLELRAMAKLDAGDRDATPSAGFVGVTGSRNIKSTETGSFGLELGAGLMVPLADDAGSLFFDVGAEFRSNYSDVNATVGYRVNF